MVQSCNIVLQNSYFVETGSRLLAAKLTITALLTFATVLLIVVAGTIDGVIAFGWHPVITRSDRHLISLPPGTALARLAISTVYVIWSLSGVVALRVLALDHHRRRDGGTHGGHGSRHRFDDP